MTKRFTERQETLGTFWDHLEELRKTLIKIFLIILIGILLSFVFYPTILATLCKPLNIIGNNSQLHNQEIKKERLINITQGKITHKLSKDGHRVVIASEGVVEITPFEFQIPPGGFLEIEIISQKKLIILGPFEGFSSIFKICFWVGVVVSSPFWLIYLYKFIVPAFENSYPPFLLSFLLLSLAFLSLGFFFAFFVTIPLANYYLAGFNATLGDNLWSLTYYLDYTLFLLLANGLTFELCVFLFFMVHLNLISPQTMKNQRKLAIVIAFILGAIFTPPDILTQLLLALPLIAFYELALLYSKIKETRSNLHLSVPHKI